MNNGNLKPFTKGDKRINKAGRPATFTALRQLAQQIAHEGARKPNGEPLTVGGHALSVTEAILRSWAHSKNPALQVKFVEICWGKVPDNVELSGAVATVELTLDQWRQEAERQRAAAAAVLEDDDGDD